MAWGSIDGPIARNALTGLMTSRAAVTSSESNQVPFKRVRLIAQDDFSSRRVAGCPGERGLPLQGVGRLSRPGGENGLHASHHRGGGVRIDSSGCLGPDVYREQDGGPLTGVSGKNASRFFGAIK